MNAQDWIDRLKLIPHPEGGYFRETYRADATIRTTDAQSGPTRNASTAIYFLLRSEDVSHFHRIDADEVWHFYAGSPITVHVLHTSGLYEAHTLGALEAPAFQTIVPAGAWFGATVDTPESYALVGCTVAPGFEFSGFEMAERNVLLSDYPAHKPLIKRLTRA